jgi:hypothetical protein
VWRGHISPATSRKFMQSTPADIQTLSVCPGSSRVFGVG